MAGRQTMADLDGQDWQAELAKAGQANTGATQRKGPRKEHREAEKEERRREKKKKAASESAPEDKGGVSCKHLFFLFIFTGPAVLPVLFGALDVLASTSVGVAVHEWGMEKGLISTYEQRITEFYNAKIPKKAKDVPRLLKKWRGRHEQLYKTVTEKFAEHERIQSIRKFAKEEKSKKSKRRKSKKSGWFGGGKSEKPKKKKSQKPQKKDDSWGEDMPPTETETEVESELDEESDDADDIMADVLRSEKGK